VQHKAWVAFRVEPTYPQSDSVSAKPRCELDQLRAADDRVFAEFERAMIRERVMSGLERAKAQGKTLGRPPIEAEKELRSAPICVWARPAS
jgi:hypothetical protein